MDVRWLQDFLTVAETGNFTRAAAIRNTSQAAFSRRIQSLEAWLGVALIDRSLFPTRLTSEGEQFRLHASEILRHVVDARAEVSGKTHQRPEQIRIALPYALATARLPSWWAEWSQGRRLAANVVLGNIHDLVTSLVSGNVDLMICFHTAQQPVHLDPDRFERAEIETETLRPYASRELVERERLALPGRKDKPIPILAYSTGVYFARLVDLALEAAPERLIGQRVLESDMADVLRDMALAGYGVAWLPRSTVDAGAGDRLVPLGGSEWTLPLSVIAFRERGNERPALNRLWAKLAKRMDGSRAPHRHPEPA